jgi:hypothetical protein
MIPDRYPRLLLFIDLFFFFLLGPLRPKDAACVGGYYARNLQNMADGHA